MFRIALAASIGVIALAPFVARAAEFIAGALHRYFRTQERHSGA